MWVAIIVAVTLLGRWAFSVDTHAQEGGGSTPTVTPMTLGEERDEEEEEREDFPNCEEPFNADHPSCSGYVTQVDRTATAEARQTATAEARRTATAVAQKTATAEARRTATAVAKTATAEANRLATVEAINARRTAVAANRTATKVAIEATLTAIGDRRATQTAVAADKTATALAEDEGTENPRPVGQPGSPTIPIRPTITPTPTPTQVAGTKPTTPVPFTIYLGYSNPYGQTFAFNNELRWYILAGGTVNLTLVPNNVSLSDYVINVVFNSDQTGIYQDTRRDATCPAHPAGSSTLFFPAAASTFIDAVRCEVGTRNNDGIVIQYKRNGSNPVHTIEFTGRIPQGMHYADLDAPYAISNATFDGAVPSYMVLDPDHDTNPGYQADANAYMLQQFVDASEVWNDEAGGKTIFRESSSSVFDVDVRGYWHGGSTDTLCAGRNPDINPLGCTISRYRRGGNAHLVGAQVWVRWPPNGLNPKNIITQWTHDLSKVQANPEIYSYMPMMLTHELGHVIGLDHLPDGNMMGGHVWGDPPTSLQPADQYGFEQVIKVLHAHR